MELAKATEQHALQLELRLNRVKLEGYGNVQFRRGGPDASWYLPCIKMVAGRFSSVSFAQHGVKGVKVLGATRVHNGVLARRYRQAVTNITSQLETAAAKKAAKSRPSNAEGVPPNVDGTHADSSTAGTGNNPATGGSAPSAGDGGEKVQPPSPSKRRASKSKA
jgi:hypothetical protein